ncbi:DUF6210 family protein [Aquimarina sp. SS2-1]|uniref:DUF6210 family protein n=1 Tax=Aquimarina besae TaxID=3342247 RepID=UPI00366CED7D
MLKPEITIHDSVGLGIIIEFPTGVMISNQTGGTACLHPKIEGVYVPLRNDYAEDTLEFFSPEIELSKYFKGSKYRGTGAVQGIDMEDVYRINIILSKSKLIECVEIDVNHLQESHEAWIWIKIKQTKKLDLIKGFEAFPLKGVLTWSNSD